MLLHTILARPWDRLRNPGPAWLMAVSVVLIALEAAPAQHRRKPAPPDYFVIQLHGTVGGEIVAERIQRCIKSGLKSADTVLILDIDSPGGLVSECTRIIEVLAQNRVRHSIAFVRSALSAGAIIALTCDEIYLQQDAMLGAAKIVSMGPGKAPTEVAEKYKSVWRATCRRAAEMGGHHPLYAEAMIDARVELKMARTGDGAIRIGRPADLQELGSARTVSEGGRLLTLTASEAVEAGLARAAVADWQGLLDSAEKLAQRKSVGKQGRTIMKAHARRYQSAKRQVQRHWKKVELAVAKIREAEARYGALGVRSREAIPRWHRLARIYRKHCKSAEAALEQMESAIKKYPILAAQYGNVADQRKMLARCRRLVRATGRHVKR